MADPHLSAADAHVVWLATATPFVIQVARVPHEFIAALTLETFASADPTLIDARHVALGAPGHAFHVLLLGAQSDAPIGIMLPLAPDFPARLDAAVRLWRRLTGGEVEPPGALPPQRRARLVTTLRALDGRMAGASTREIAAALFGSDRVPAGPEWKAHDLRSRAKRLVASGLALMNGGYRELLRPHRGRRDD